MNTNSHTTTGRCSSGFVSDPAHLVQVGFTIQEHLEVQRQIEQCAYRFWQAHGGHAGHTLSNWLEAESRVLAKFIMVRAGTLKRTLTRSGTTPRLRALVIPQLQSASTTGK
jgi:hypothetical protein